VLGIIKIYALEKIRSSIKILRLFEFKINLYKDPYGYPNFLIATNKQYEQ